MDVTELKYFMHRANLHRTNPPLFKRISDVAKMGEFKATWTLE